MHIASIFLVALILLGIGAQLLRKRTAGRSAVRQRQRPAFSVGQVWAYKTRPHEGASRLTIVRIERFGRGNAVHIHVSNVSIRNPASPIGVSTFITHMPFAETALADSVVRRVEAKGPLPDFEEGYAAWKKQATARRAGLFNIGVAQAITGIERGFTNAPAKPWLTNRMTGEQGTA